MPSLSPLQLRAESSFTWSRIQQHPRGAYRPCLLEPDCCRGTVRLHTPHSASDRSSPGTAHHDAQWTIWPKRNQGGSYRSKCPGKPEFMLRPQCGCYGGDSCSPGRHSMSPAHNAGRKMQRPRERPSGALSISSNEDYVIKEKLSSFWQTEQHTQRSHVHCLTLQVTLS